MKRFVTSSESIFALAKTKSDIEAYLDDATRPIILHLIKLYFYNDSEDLKHWRQEVYSFLNSVPRLKSKKKFPSKDFILNNTINLELPYLNHLIYIIESEYGKPQEANIDGLKSNIIEYFVWLATELSKTGIVGRVDVYRKLDELSFGVS